MPPRRRCSATSFLPGFEPVFDGPHAARIAERRAVPMEKPDPPEEPVEAARPSLPAPATHAAQVEARRGPKQAARDILAAIRTLKTLEAERRAATAEERAALSRFGGFGPVAKEIFPDPRTKQYKPGWREIGEELKDLLSDCPISDITLPLGVNTGTPGRRSKGRGDAASAGSSPA